MASQDNQSVVRSTGKVSWFSDSKGYGFIKPDEEGEELFVHQSSIVSDGFRSLTVNESVEFEIAEGDDGKTKAVEVTAPGGGPLKNKKETGGNGRNSRRGGNRCFNCGEFGHMAKECEGEPKKEGCYECGESGHFARDCVKGLTERVAEVRVSGGGGGGKECYKCGEVGHIARECGGRREGGGGGCYTCGGVGHMARECPTKTGECYECGGTGHFARDCVKRGGGGGGGNKKKGCFTCGNVGHFAKECQQVA